MSAKYKGDPRYGCRASTGWQVAHERGITNSKEIFKQDIQLVGAVQGVAKP